ncbi:type IV secretory system conjugative DNA transfer family protein [Salipiger thiooxidans]|uniref:type IV secretory system conjugative DNA transfer family protein n=1 Tax=Salipiger thiooxidans TaxID=282683 RepID=UPI001A8CE3FF|nr:type IV secretory system conjugative DNA transfer family protein [Salipiger thiooxidans]MBN8189776.1 type IV secretory system conjugative DNA transfer family protein [Salipiger thiooxidans]
MIQNLDTAWRYPLAVIVGLLAGGYIGAMLATIYGAIVFRESLNSLDPLEPWFLRWSWPTLQANPDALTVIGLINGAVALGLVAVGVAGVYRGRLTNYDNAHFQTRRELRRNRMVVPISAEGFVFGKTTRPKKTGLYISATPSRFPHAMMVAPTGRGKGVGFVIPNLLHHTGSAIVLDVKGENFEKTSIHRQNGLGNKIWYFSPFDYVEAEGGPSTRTHRFNPLARIAAMSSTDQQYTALNTLADQFLVVEGDQAKGFYQAGKRLFVAACLFAIEQGRPNLGFAKEIFGGGGKTEQTYRDYAEMTDIPIVATIFSEMAGMSQKITDSYRSVISGAGFELWDDPSVVRATTESDFDLTSFRREAQTLYITMQAEHLKTLAPLVRLLFAEAIASLQRAEPGPDEPHTVMFLMDEFDQLGRQPLVENSIKTIRSFGGRFFIITQSIAGLDNPSLYGEAGRRALMAGAGVKVFMTPQDDRTATVLSDMLGKHTVVSKTESQSRIRELDDSANISRRSEERPLISPGKLLQFPLDQVLILPEGQYPIQAHHIRYYEDQHFAAIEAARQGHALPYPPLTAKPKRKVASLAQIAQAQETVETCQMYSERFAEMRARAEAGRKSEGGSGAASRRRPRRAGATDLGKFEDADGGVQQEESEKV